MALRAQTFACAALLSGAVRAREAGPIAHWSFEEDEGTGVRDLAGGGHGVIHNAQWESGAAGGALRFPGRGGYVACPRPPQFDGSGEWALVAWVKPMARPFRNARTNYVVFASQGHAENGFVIRVEGGGQQVRYVAFKDGGVSGVSTSNTPLTADEYHQVAFVKRGNETCWYLNGRPDGGGAVKDHGPLRDEVWISGPAQSFDGQIGDVRLYGSALMPETVIRDYRDRAAQFGKDTSGFGRILLTPHYYLRWGKLAVEANCTGVLPLEEGERLSAELGPEGEAPIEVREVMSLGGNAVTVFDFELGEAAPGHYQVRVCLTGAGEERASAAVEFDYPPGPVRLPSPDETTVGLLPAPAPPAGLSLRPSAGGGFTIHVNGEEFGLESRYSYPHGGENVLTPAATVQGGPGWGVVLDAGAGVYRVTGEGPHYRVERTISVHVDRVAVRDVVRNKTAEPLGIILRNQVVVEGRELDPFLAGTRGGAERDIKINPTVFLAGEGVGLGLIALDDVYVVQARGFCEDGRAGISSGNFALAAGAEYALEWAVYVNGTGDYYDFVNAVRRDEGRGGVTVEGGFAFHRIDRVPGRDYLDLRGIRYFSGPCLSNVIDDPSVSLEGIEFVEYPKVCDQLRRQFEGVRALDSSVKCMFHIAHALYATDRPDDLFPDSRLVDANGKQHVYGDGDGYYYSRSYFSKERLDAGWRWWIHYPTLENSFGRAMLRSVDVMMDRIGCRGAFMDGFMWTYGSAYTYDRWDGHSADIDPATKTITRKKGSVLLLSQGLLAEYVGRINARGGTLIANYPVFTRTIAREKMICDQECRVGPDIHLTHTPITLGRPARINSERDVYRDVREALSSGNLYFYYGEKEITHPSVPKFMYPITIQDIRAGCVTGRERVVTMNSGVYGWPGDRDLHQTYLFDRQGVLAPHEFLTTVDAGGVRTDVRFGPEETAVVRRIPLALRAERPVNVLCEQYDAAGIRLILHGAGEGQLTVRDGDFAVPPNAPFSMGPEDRRATSDAAGVLRAPLVLAGQTEIHIRPGG